MILNGSKAVLNELKHFVPHMRKLHISEGDLIAFDDTKIEHPYRKKMPFLCWLFDKSTVYESCINTVSMS